MAQRLCDVLLSRSGDGAPVDLADAFSCFGFDIITTYCFGQERGLLKENNFDLSFRKTIHGGLEIMPIGRQWPLIPDLVQALPDWVAMKINPDFVRFGKYLGDIKTNIDRLMHEHSIGGKNADIQESILVDMLENDLHGNDRFDNPTEYLSSEAAVLPTAGTDTTAWTLSVQTFHLLNSPQILSKLTAELRSTVRDPEHLPNWSTLEQLPYLTAVILESI